MSTCYMYKTTTFRMDKESASPRQLTDQLTEKNTKNSFAIGMYIY